MKFSNIKFSIVLVFISTFFLSCSKCPPHKKLGDLSLTPESVAHQKFNNAPYYNFVDSAGVIKQFRYVANPTDQNTSRITVATTCNEGFLDQTDFYYEGSSHKMEFESTQDRIDYTYATRSAFNNGMPKDTIFYDVLIITGYINNNYNTLNIVTSYRGNKSAAIAFGGFYEDSSMVSDTTLLGNKFKNVYVDNKPIPSIYYTKSDGVIAMHDGKKLWVLDKK